MDRRIGLHWRSLCLWRSLFLSVDYSGSLEAIFNTLCSLPFPASPRRFSLVFFSPPSQDFERIRKSFFEQVSSFAVLPVFMDDINWPVCTTHEPECLQKGRMQSFHFLGSLTLVHLLLSHVYIFKEPPVVSLFLWNLLVELSRYKTILLLLRRCN